MLESERSALYVDSETTISRRLCDTPSPYQHLLDLPSSEEALLARLQIKEYIDRLRAELYAVEERIEQLRLSLQRAEQDCNSIRCRIDAHIALNPPIHDIPPEILSQVFSHACTAPLKLSESNKDVPPWVLGKVCSRWRQVAWNTPSLWSSLSLSFKFNTRKLDWKKRVVAEALARSRQTSLILDINFFALTDVDERRNLISEWKELRAFPCLDNLEELDLAYRPHLGVGEEGTPLFDVTMPRLFHFSLESNDLTPFLPDSPRIALPWLQLTSLHIRNDSAAIHSTRAHLHRVISRCPNLVTLKVWTMTLPGERTPQVTLPRLRNLHIVCPVILAKLTCPVLHRLTMEIHSYSNLLIPSCVEGFFSRSGCMVQEVQISLYHPSCPPSFVTAVLKPFLAVRHLDLDFTHATPPFDTYFQALVDNTVLFPLLQSLTVKSSPLNLQCATDAYGGSMSERVILEALVPCPAFGAAVFASGVTSGSNEESEYLPLREQPIGCRVRCYGAL